MLRPQPGGNDVSHERRRGGPMTMPKTTRKLDQAYTLARERYAALGVDTDQALATLRGIPISLHCWQGDDVGGFETAGGALGDGLAVTGNYPGKARTPEQLPGRGALDVLGSAGL